MNPRINVTLDPETYALLREISKKLTGTVNYSMAVKHCIAIARGTTPMIQVLVHEVQKMTEAEQLLEEDLPDLDED